MSIFPIKCSLLEIRFPTISIDLHDTVIPPFFGPPIPTPYFWVQVLSGLMFATVKMTTSVYSRNYPFTQRGSDIGNLIVHVGNPVNILLPFIILGSGSKTEFGSFSVLAEGKPVSAAFPFITGTLNLNCQGPSKPLAPLPTGNVIAPNTNMVGMKIADILVSLTLMIIDMGIQAAVNKLGDKLGKMLSKRWFPNPGTTFYLSPNFINRCRNMHAVENLTSFIISTFGAGAPLGYSRESIKFLQIPNLSRGLAEIDSIYTKKAQGFNDYFNNAELL